MSFADRGLASNLVGDRWADLAANYAAAWADGSRTIRGESGDSLPVVRVDRLDAMPRIASLASRRGLQNPDLLLVGRFDGRSAVQAADAKFSIETARSKQVSPEVVAGLIGLREHLPELLPELDGSFHIEPGIFLSPDYPLTHLMLEQDRRVRRGILRSTVRPHEVVLVPVDPKTFWDGVEGASVIAPLAEVDAISPAPEASLLSGLYYFRLARAVAGFWLDATKPLLLCNDTPRLDERALRSEAVSRAGNASSAIALIRAWDADVESIRNQRAAVEQVAGLPIPGRELRSMANRIAERAGAEPPSANQVRRRLGAWYRGELRDRVGPISPPVENLGSVLKLVAAAGRDVAPRVEAEFERIVLELIQDAEASETNTDFAGIGRPEADRISELPELR